MALIGTRHNAGDADLAAVLALIQTTFAYMDGIVDPPSSAHRLTLDDLDAQCTTGEVWSLGTPIAACMTVTPLQDALYVGKLAVADTHRGHGLARALIDLAEARARALNLPALDLQSRIELTRNHTVFTAMGFVEISRSAHPGFARPTSIRFRKWLG